MVFATMFATTIITSVPMKIVTSACPLIVNPNVVTVVFRATAANHTLVVTHTVVIYLHVPLPTTIIRTLLRGARAENAQLDAVLLPPVMIIHLLNVEESCLGGDMSPQKR